MNKNLITLLISIVAFSLLYTIALPLYTDTGLNLLEKKSIMVLQSENEELKQSLDTAKSLATYVQTESINFNEIPPIEKMRIDMSIPKKIDLVRVINDVNQMANNNNLAIEGTRFARSSQGASNIPNLNFYKIDFTLEGSYSDFKNFVKVVENSLQLYTIKTISFTKTDDARTPEFKFNVSLETYETNN